jgi:endonuclease G, mitochondrial
MSTEDGRGTVRISVPLKISVSIGTPAPSDGAAWKDRRIRVPEKKVAPAAGDEARRTADDYADRTGYVERFLGAGLEIDYPTIAKKKSDVLTFDVGGKTESILRYKSFSVVMSKSRRMCRYSACNIDGGESKKTPRPGWRYDPRISEEYQIKDECYGAPPKFSRGHMTRREDPAWGTKAEAALGCADSMHVTNAVPQMQAFNSPIWLELEDYALQNARQDDMKISVFTGPYLFDDDPWIYEVQIPRRFWKVIAFVHDETGELTATGYEMGQEDNLPSEDEFVFGQLVSRYTNVATQVSIASIEAKSGLRFGDLARRDPFSEEEALDSRGEPLLTFDQIRFK